MPIAAVIDGAMYAVHSDHLNTPRRLTNASGQAVWQWSYSAFGEDKPTVAKNRFANLEATPNPGTTGISEVKFNLRYPGQYADGESGLFYNYFRSYDARTGRYSQSDPIGLDGGWNRFGYVDANPLSWIGLVKILGVPNSVGETSLHANPGPNATNFRPEHGPDHVHLGGNDGPRVTTDSFKPYSKADAMKMTRKQTQFCEGLSEESKDLIRTQQRNIFEYGSPEPPQRPNPKIPVPYVPGMAPLFCPLCGILYPEGPGGLSRNPS
jgi:RHS repeat-associated protein